MHVVFKSLRATGAWSLLRKAKEVRVRVNEVAQQFEVKLLDYANGGNHLHLAIQAKKKKQIQDFLRVLPQAVAFLVTGTRKGNPIGRFWHELVFSRIVEWGEDWDWIQKYFEINRREVAGEDRAMLQKRLRDLWRSIWRP